MTCPDCHQKNNDGAKFCRFCGTRLVTYRHANLEKESTDTWNYAGFGIRLAAYIVDLLGIYIVSFGIGIVLGVLELFFLGENSTLVIPDTVWSYVGYVIYNTFCLAVWSTTLGKAAFGLKVTNMAGNKLTFGDALKRSILQPFSTILFGIGYWQMHKHPNRQAWHDSTANTLVMRKDKSLWLGYLLVIASILANIILLAYLAE